MKHDIRLGAFAITDLIALKQWVAREAGQRVAKAYLDRVEAKIAALADFPDRGTPRGNLGPRVRTLAFERRLIIAYHVEALTATVLRVVSTARDLGAAFAS